MNKQQLIDELESTPDFLIQEVYDFLLFLKTKVKVQPIPDSSPANNNPILQMIDEITAEVPLQEWDQLPKDFSQQLDHYLYGVPKQES
ncbi:hypothetical protein VB712_02595 [Spirulina sp. CCNP1310]|uniref:hypothetical protein n=1 Tax=Spirulina sp. CCNP1310 TaxID=3110249 RepID=UPI002B1FC253|nr:hypothetical protein [Spirulina sp. CCNP1310]MEA5418095.1 hypothetical protein [Spirulina sp. CCNP1310]